MTSNSDNQTDEETIKQVSFPNVDDYEWNSRWLQIEAERAWIPAADVGEQESETPPDKPS